MSKCQCVVILGFIVILCNLLSCNGFFDVDEEEVTLDQVFGIQTDTRRSFRQKIKRTPKVLDIAALTDEAFEKNFKLIEDEFKPTEEDKKIIEKFLNEEQMKRKAVFEQYANFKPTEDEKKMFEKHLKEAQKKQLPVFGNDTRRFALPYRPHDSDKWVRAQHNAFMTKTADNSLQILYMARYKIREIEKHPLYNNNSPGYRLAFLYMRLRKLRNMIRLVYSIVEKRYYYIYNERGWDWWINIGARLYDPNTILAKHMRIVAYHTEFNYIWWNIVKLHEEICNEKHIYMTKPTTPTTTATTESKPKG